MVKRRQTAYGWILGLVLLTIGIFLLSLTIGSYPLTWEKLENSMREGTFWGTDMSMTARVFWQLRLPRVLTGLLAGMTLGLCGGLYQMLFQSPLASPDLTGVASGASFGAALAILLGAEGVGKTVEGMQVFTSINTFLGTSAGRMTAAFLGGMTSLGLVFLLLQAAGPRGRMMQGCVLAGIVISSLADGGLMVLKTMADPERQLAAIDFWTMGSLAAVSSRQAVPLAIVVLPVMGLLLLCRRPVSMLALGEESAAAMGVSAKLWRMILLTLSTLSVSAVTAVTGVIGFVGLIAPHITRLIIRRTNGMWLVGSTLVGGLLLLAADIGARSFGNGAELPVSIFTVAAGVPVLVVLFCKSGRMRG